MGITGVAGDGVAGRMDGRGMGYRECSRERERISASHSHSRPFFCLKRACEESTSKNCRRQDDEGRGRKGRQEKRMASDGMRMQSGLSVPVELSL